MDWLDTSAFEFKSATARGLYKAGLWRKGTSSKYSRLINNLTVGTNLKSINRTTLDT
jgi:hypothetical protein